MILLPATEHSCLFQTQQTLVQRKICKLMVKLLKIGNRGQCYNTQFKWSWLLYYYSTRGTMRQLCMHEYISRQPFKKMVNNHSDSLFKLIQRRMPFSSNQLQLHWQYCNALKIEPNRKYHCKVKSKQNATLHNVDQINKYVDIWMNIYFNSLSSVENVPLTNRIAMTLKFTSCFYQYYMIINFIIFILNYFIHFDYIISYQYW